MCKYFVPYLFGNFWYCKIQGLLSNLSLIYCYLEKNLDETVWVCLHWRISNKTNKQFISQRLYRGGKWKVYSVTTQKLIFFQGDFLLPPSTVVNDVESIGGLSSGMNNNRF